LVIEKAGDAGNEDNGEKDDEFFLDFSQIREIRLDGFVDV
jgi:hypothetical protein